jgi:hypothetical protein
MTSRATSIQRNEERMADASTAVVVEQLRAVLRESFEGPAGQQWTYFIDNEPSGGVFGTIDQLSAAQASIPSGRSGTSVAAHVHHLAFAVAASRAWLEGDRTQRDWNQSWRVSRVSDAEWARLRAELWREYEELTKVVEMVDLSKEMAVGLVIGAVAHSAYHLGAMRQKISLGMDDDGVA